MNLQRRILEHNGLLKGGAKYTLGRRPVKLVYKEYAKTYSLALKREIQIKKLSREDKIQLLMEYGK